jgi:hypothetical protein
MSTTTPNLGLTKPTPGDVADRNVWGTTLNGNLDLLDAIFKSDGTGTSVGLNVGIGKTLSVSGTITVPTQTAGDNSTKAASTAFIATALGSYVTTTSLTSTLSSYAPLASPALTGNPTAPTQTGTDNSTKISTTAFVQTALGSYAPLASPALTGTPTAPTQTAGDSSTKLATTAFVQAALPSVLLDKTNITSAQANYVLTGIPSTINSIDVFYDLLPATTSVDLHITFYDSTGTEITSASYFWTTENNSDTTASVAGGGTNGTAATSGTLCWTNNALTNNATTGGVAGRMTMFGLQSARMKRAQADNAGAIAAVDGAFHTNGVVTCSTTSTITGFKLFFTSGNIASGTVRVIGYP